MKKLLLFCLFSLLLASVCYAGPFDREEFKNVGYVDSVTKTSDGTVSSSPCYVYGVTVYSTSGVGSVALYNSTDGSGSILIETTASATGYTSTITFDKPVKFDTACYADVANSYAVVQYRQ